MSGKIIGLTNISRAINNRLKGGIAHVDLSVLGSTDLTDATWSIDRGALEKLTDLFATQYNAEVAAYRAIQEKFKPLIEDPNTFQALAKAWDAAGKAVRNANALSFLYHGIYKLARREMTADQEAAIKNKIDQITAGNSEHLAELYVGILRNTLSESPSLKTRRRRPGSEGSSQGRF